MIVAHHVATWLTVPKVPSNLLFAAPMVHGLAILETERVFVPMEQPFPSGTKVTFVLPLVNPARAVTATTVTIVPVMLMGIS